MPSPHLTPISDDLRMAIGDVTIAAASLEFHLTFLGAVARNEGDEWVRAQMSTPGKAQRQLAAVCDEVDEPGLRGQLQALARDARAVLDDRSRLVHAVALFSVDPDDKTHVYFWHARSDQEVKVDSSQVADHVQDLNTVAARALYLTGVVDSWRSSRERV